MYIIVFVTASNRKEARAIADGLIKQKLAACVNITGPIESVFWWKGKIDRAREFLLLVKSRRRLLPRIIAAVKRLHSYEVPEIIAVNIAAGEKKYLRWIDDACRTAA